MEQPTMTGRRDTGCVPHGQRRDGNKAFRGGDSHARRGYRRRLNAAGHRRRPHPAMRHCAAAGHFGGARCHGNAVSNRQDGTGAWHGGRCAKTPHADFGQRDHRRQCLRQKEQGRQQPKIVVTTAAQSDYDNPFRLVVYNEDALPKVPSADAGQKAVAHLPN